MRSREAKNTKFAYKVNLPLMVFLGAVLVFPLAWGICMSFTNKMIGGEAHFTGFKNYEKLIGDPEYRRSIVNTVKFTALSIALKCVLGMFMALALNQSFRGRNAVRALLMIPWTLPNIVVVYNWRWIFNPSGGIANHILKSLHLIDRDLVWFGSAGLALFTVVVANVWRGTPFFGVSILAKLQTISRDYYEAADIDGANLFQKFRYITFPEVKDVTILSALMSTIWTINEFETVPADRRRTKRGYGSHECIQLQNGNEKHDARTRHSGCGAGNAGTDAVNRAADKKDASGGKIRNMSDEGKTQGTGGGRK